MYSIVQYFYRWDDKMLGSDHGERSGNRLMYKHDADSSPENADIDLGSDLIIHVKVFALAIGFPLACHSRITNRNALRFHRLSLVG